VLLSFPLLNQRWVRIGTEVGSDKGSDKIISVGLVKNRMHLLRDRVRRIKSSMPDCGKLPRPYLKNKI
jgi:hypothetical protein